MRAINSTTALPTMTVGKRADAAADERISVAMKLPDDHRNRSEHPRHGKNNEGHYSQARYEAACYVRNNHSEVHA